MNNYRILNRTFKTFREVNQYVWNTHKMELYPDLDEDTITEEDKHRDCTEIAVMELNQMDEEEIL